MSSTSHSNIPSVLMIFWSTKKECFGGGGDHMLCSSHRFKHSFYILHKGDTRVSQGQAKCTVIPNIQLVTCKSQQCLTTNARFQCQINANGVATKHPVKEQEEEQYRW